MANSNRSVIYKPAWSECKIQRAKLAELTACMGWKQAQFAKFTAHVRSAAVAMDLDLEAGPDRQHAVKWADFMQNCIDTFPSLTTDFEDAWPVELYFTKYTYIKWSGGSRYGKGTRKQPERSASLGIEKHKGKAEKEKTAPANSKKTSLDRTKIVPGKPSQSHSLKRTSSFSFRPVSSDTVRIHTFPSLPSSYPHGKSQRGRITTTATTAASSSTFASAAERAAWQACVLCGFQPPVPRAQKVALLQFFQGREDLRPGFDAAGIVADYHFRCVLRLRAQERDGFLQSLAPAKINPLEVVMLCDMLQDHVDGGQITEARAKKLAPGADTRAKIPQMEVPRPSQSVLDDLSLLECDPTRIMEHMEIADEEDYFDLVVRDLALKGLNWVSLIRSLTAQRRGNGPAFPPNKEMGRSGLGADMERTAVIWKIRRVLAHDGLHEAIPCCEIGGVTGTLSAPEARHECPHKHHSPSHSVPPAIVALLSENGMEELGPAFLALGLHSDRRFADIIASRTLKTQLLGNANLKHLKLTDFQIMMIRHILGEAY
ncbi:hypothetical protein B0H17DRAFT_1134582 [Mycena rosella]|uniref:Uncharacterized protein n=1 Tax=Mycena rosella TaxID=1033263 RepID=A0AAD7DFH5_MYCRO|nr:hypothetical protein B0H17DRAFT_1134582 [Mycena rosella]